MVSLELAVVEEPQTLNADSSGTDVSYDNSTCIDPPVSAYPSSTTIYPESQTFSPHPGVRQVWYHDVPLSIIAVSDHFPQLNICLDLGFFRSVMYTLLQ